MDDGQRQTGADFAMGLLVGLLAGAIVCSAAAYLYVRNASRIRHETWNLVPVVVASRDLPEGTVVQSNDLSQRAVPEQFVTSSCVKSDSANYVIDQTLLVPMQAGDTLLWSHFETRKGASVLFAVKDIPAGKALAQEDTEEKVIPQRYMTRSYVKTEERPQVVGRVTLAPFRQGDPILWTHFKPTAR